MRLSNNDSNNYYLGLVGIDDFAVVHQNAAQLIKGRLSVLVLEMAALDGIANFLKLNKQSSTFQNYRIQN